MIEMKCNDFSCYIMPLGLVLACHDAISILKVTMTFSRSRKLQLDLILPLLLVSHDVIGISISVSYNNNIINGITVFLR